MYKRVQTGKNHNKLVFTEKNLIKIIFKDYKTTGERIVNILKSLELRNILEKYLFVILFKIYLFISLTLFVDSCNEITLIFKTRS